MKTLVVHAIGRYFEHPILLPPRNPAYSSGALFAEDMPLPPSALRALGWPEHEIPQALKDMFPTIGNCRTERGAEECSCGHYKLEWMPTWE